MDDSERSYIDYDTFLDPDFSAASYANKLVTATNNASDTPIDLSTPLSRVLFDQQEIDTHIHTLTTKSALPLLSHTQKQATSSQHILTELESQISALTEGYAQLEAEVVQRYATAEEVRLAVSRLWVTVKIGRSVARALQLGRQLDAQMGDIKINTQGTTPRMEDHGALVRAAHSILSLRALFDASGPGEEGEHLARINVVNTLRTDLVSPSEQRLRSRAQQIIREFSLSSLAASSVPSSSSDPNNQIKPQSASAAPSPSSTPSFAQTSETKARTTSACLTLYRLSPPAPATPSQPAPGPALLLAALNAYLQAALTSSLAGVARALASLPTLPRALSEVAARCHSVAGLEALLAGIPPPSTPDTAAIKAATHLGDGATTTAIQDTQATQAARGAPENLLIPLLSSLDTHSLPSYFWRSLASGLGGRVGEILSKGGVPARNLRAQRERVREAVREAVLKGCEGAVVRDEDGREIKGLRGGEWEREVMVVVGAVAGGLGR